MTGPKTYVSKPSEIEAVQWKGTPESTLELFEFVGRIQPANITYAIKAWTEPEPGAELFVAANKAWLDLEVGEWVAKDDHGFYPIKDDVFCRKYEPKNLNDGYDPLQQAIKAVNARNSPTSAVDTGKLT